MVKKRTKDIFEGLTKEDFAKTLHELFEKALADEKPKFAINPIHIPVISEKFQTKETIIKELLKEILSQRTTVQIKILEVAE